MGPFLSNWSLVLSGWDGYVNRAPVSFDILWSIAIEEQFYLAFPPPLVAALGYVLVERPGLRLKDRLVRPGHLRAAPA